MRVCARVFHTFTLCVCVCACVHGRYILYCGIWYLKCPPLLFPPPPPPLIRYQSLNRSFHGSRGHRRDNAPSPLNSLDPFNMSLTIHLDQSESESFHHQSLATAAKAPPKPGRFAFFQKSSKAVKQTSREGEGASDNIIQLTPVLARSSLDAIPVASEGSSAEVYRELTNSDSPESQARTHHHTLRTGSPDMNQMMRELSSPSAPQGEAAIGIHLDRIDVDEEAGTRVDVARGDSQQAAYGPRHPSMLREASVENSYEGGTESNVRSKEPEGVGSEDQSKPLSPALLDSPALQFILRKDLYSFLNSAGVS